MRLLVLGTGMIGTAVVHELAKSPAIDEIVAVDAQAASVDRCVTQAQSSKVSDSVAVLADYDRLVELRREADIAVACLPHSLSPLAIRAAIAAGCHLVDLVGSKYEEKAELNGQAAEAGVLVVPGADVAPGILYEKTVRYKGHWEKMSVLAELGFLDETPVEIDGIPISPRKLAIPLLERKMKGGSNEDITVLRVTVTGTRNGKKTKLEWEMVDSYDNERNITSMARTTGYPAVILAEWLAEGRLTKRGVAAIEDVIIGERFDPFVAELGSRGIRISFKEENPTD